jgi:hypothetical protein
VAETLITVCTICEANPPEVCPECAMMQLTPAQAIAPELHQALEQLVEAIDTMREYKHSGVARVARAMKTSRLLLDRLPALPREEKPRVLPRFYGPIDDWERRSI